jgi:hypothetical protein
VYPSLCTRTGLNDAVSSVHVDFVCGHLIGQNKLAYIGQSGDMVAYVGQSPVERCRGGVAVGILVVCIFPRICMDSQK